jgi:hypothetical protein
MKLCLLLPVIAVAQFSSSSPALYPPETSASYPPASFPQSSFTAFPFPSFFGTSLYPAPSASLYRPLASALPYPALASASLYPPLASASLYPPLASDSLYPPLASASLYPDRASASLYPAPASASLFPAPASAVINPPFSAAASVWGSGSSAFVPAQFANNALYPSSALLPPQAVSSSAFFQTPPANNAFSPQTLPSFAPFQAPPSMGRAATVTTEQEAELMFPEFQTKSPEAQRCSAFLASSPQVRDIHDLTNEQLHCVKVLSDEYVTKKILREHEQWHSMDNGFGKPNSIGGTGGPATGSGFGGMHAVMLWLFERFIAPNFKLPIWLPNTRFPSQLTINEKYASLGVRSSQESDPHVEIDGFFLGIPNEDGVSLFDCTNPDDVWRFIGLMVHNNVHANTGSVMRNSAVSVSDTAIFFFWHGTLQRLFEGWLACPNGQTWQATHPNHPLHPNYLLRNPNPDIHIFDKATPFVNDSPCQLSPSIPICAFLQKKQDFIDSKPFPKAMI